MPDDLVTLRKQTKAFIDEEPRSIALQRKDITPDGEGGVQHTILSLPAQIFNLITQATSAQVARRTMDGEEVFPEFVLLGEYNADMKNGDWFLIDGIKYEVVYVRLERRYETWGEVAYRG